MNKIRVKFNNFCLSLFKFFVRFIAITACVVIVLVIFFSFYDFPRFMIKKGLAIPNKSSFYFDIERVRLNFFSGVIFKNIYVYRKEKPGEAGVHIKTMITDINWFDMFQSHRRIRKVKFLNTSIKSRQLIVPAIDGEGGLPPPFNLFIESSLYFKDLYLDGVWVLEMTADAKCRGSKLFVEHIAGSLGNLENPGTFSGGTMVYDSEKALIDIDISAKLNPYFLVPLFTRWGNTTLVDFIHRFDKETMHETTFVGTIERDFNSIDSMLLKGLFEVDESKYNNVDFLSAESELTIYTSKEGSSIKGEKSYVVRDEGLVHGSFITEGDYSEIKFQGKSTIEPVELLQLMNIKNEFIEEIDFITQPTITATGKVSPRNYTNNSFYANIDSGNFVYSNFYFTTFKSGVIVNGITNQFKEFDSDFYDGKINGDLTFCILDNSYTNVEYYGNFVLDSVNYGLFAPVLGMDNSEAVSGRFNGKVKLDGVLSDVIWSEMNASGYFSIKDGWLFRMKIFGGLSKLLGEIIPGLDFVMSQSDATIDFEMKKGIVDIQRLVVNGDVLSVSATGKANMITRTYDMKVQVKFMKQHTFVAKFINTIVWPLSKFFEMSLTGTFENPVWKAVNF
ncbi:MAG: hypothetical protein PF692_04420 [Kiritimatiellae bacterium]|jgi:hypothetical protein|nr:hypothetical protein [Kiritimatiellia bacterium]